MEMLLWFIIRNVGGLHGLCSFFSGQFDGCYSFGDQFVVETFESYLLVIPYMFLDHSSP